MDLSRRDRFTFSGGQFAGFASNFSKTVTSGYGERYSGRVGAIAVFAVMKYGVETGAQYKNYEEEDTSSS